MTRDFPHRNTVPLRPTAGWNFVTSWPVTQTPRITQLCRHGSRNTISLYQYTFIIFVLMITCSFPTVSSLVLMFDLSLILQNVQVIILRVFWCSQKMRNYILSPGSSPAFHTICKMVSFIQLQHMVQYVIFYTAYSDSLYITWTKSMMFKKDQALLLLVKICEHV